MDSRERLLNAAVELMNTEGLAALSMREVARRAGVSHRAPYHYFENRKAVLAAIAEEGFKKFNAALESASGRVWSPPVAFMSILRSRIRPIFM